MDLTFNKEDRQFQAEIRSWLDDNFESDIKPAMAKSSIGRLSRENQVVWQQRLASKGWAAPNWPEEYGGSSFTATQQYIFDLEMSRAGAPVVLPFGITMVAPVIMKFGTQAQKEKYLPGILNSDVWWCQGYSEPGSGSDLASLKTKAEDQGDHYLVNGTKTWITLAQHADWIFCLVRTSQEDKPQKGISFLLIDMKTPGITVQPIITLDTPEAPHHEINMIFFEDVKVPKENLVGEEGKGWTCAKYLLEFERGNPYSASLYAALDRVKTIASSELQDGETVMDDPDFKKKLDELEIAINAMEFTELRILGSLATGQNLGPESSLLKCRGTEMQQQVTELALEAVGHYGMPFDHRTPDDVGSNQPSIGPLYSAGAPLQYFNTRKVSIYAGSNEIQRNIMAKLVLGL